MIAADLPLVTMVLICFNQENTIDAAIDGALGQDYPNLEIVISDDASSDNTYDHVWSKISKYTGKHQVRVIRNSTNLGIGGNLDAAVKTSHGELIFIAAGDDVSIPQRVSLVVNHWLQHQKRPNLIAAFLNDIDESGNSHGVIRISDLASYQSVEDWWRLGPPHVIGAAQAWTRLLFDEFGGIPSGVVGEDMLMAFRAIASGSAITLSTPLVNYRRGGLTSQRRSLSSAEVIHGLTRKLNSSRIELRCMLRDARAKNASQRTLDFLAKKLDKECFIANMFESKNVISKLHLCLQHSKQPLDFRVRIFVYATAPWLLAPFFYLKRLRYK